jgi:hypothetical protein
MQYDESRNILDNQGVRLFSCLLESCVVRYNPAASADGIPALLTPANSKRKTISLGTYPDAEEDSNLLATNTTSG